MDYSLKNKARNSIKWTLIKTLFNSLLQPIYRILLAILLTPSEFGYIAVIILVVSIAELLNDFGIGEAIIQRDNVTSQDLSTVFFFNLIITSLISFTLYISAGLIEMYYSMPSLELIIKIMSLVALINGSTSIFKFYLHKYFFFKETSLIQILKITIEIFLTLFLIVQGLGIWSYIIGVLVSNLFQSFGSTSIFWTHKS